MKPETRPYEKHMLIPKARPPVAGWGTHFVRKREAASPFRYE